MIYYYGITVGRCVPACRILRIGSAENGPLIYRAAIAADAAGLHFPLCVLYGYSKAIGIL